MKLVKFTAAAGDCLQNIKANIFGISHIQAAEIIKNKDIIINGVRANTNLKLFGGEEISVYYNDAKIKEYKPYKVVFEDKNILVAFKNQGIESEKLAEMLKLNPVHRLDFNTEGLNIFAKNERTLEEFEKAFEQKQVIKNYLALVHGEPKRPGAVLNHHLVKDKEASTVKILPEAVKGSLPVKTSYTLLRQIGDFNLLDVQLFTGRTHQIRAHLAYVKLYILGDGKYGNAKINKLYGVSKQCLTASRLGFEFEKGSPLAYLNENVFEVQPTWLNILKRK